MNPTHAIDLAEGWVFRRGDDLGWAAPEIPGEGWTPIKVGVYWQSAGHPGYNGWGWYRTRVRIPSALRDNPAYARTHTILLSLGPVDDCDQTFLNGSEVGRTGDLPPNYSSAYNIPRRYRIPEELIKWDADNTIAVRVYDGGGNGGICPGPVTLGLPGLADFVTAEIGLGRGDGIFAGPGPVPVALTIRNGYVTTIKGTLVCRIATDDRKPVETFEKDVEIPRDGTGKAEFVFTPPHPGFYRVDFSIANAADGASFSAGMNLGFDPEKQVAPLTRQPDFQQYWDDARKDLAGITPGFALTRKPEMDNQAVEVSLVEMRSIGNARIRGWLTVPRKPGRYSAILQVPGHSAPMSPALDVNDMVVLALDIRGHGNSKDDVNPGFPGYMVSGIEDKMKYIYRGAYMDCVRGVDYLVSRPDVDPKRIGVEGGSQGGALSFATAALDSRIALAATDVPFLSDFHGYCAVAEWPKTEFAGWLAQNTGRTWDDVHRVLSYIDIKNLAPWIKCPVLMSAGLQDPTCPPRINFAAYNQVKGDKEYRVYPHGDHGGGGDVHRKLKYAWIRKRFGLPAS
jgi:cephalosporin-C deacetylase-like acetyl esterase